LKNLLIISFIFFSVGLYSQHKVGVRAGLNYSQFSGPLEANETFSMSSGFHFGVNYTYELPTNIGFRAELLYIQRGSKQKYDDENSFYIINPIEPSTMESFVEPGHKVLDMNITSSYLSIPLTVQYRLNRKFEIYGGASLDFMIGPNGRGKVDFESSVRRDDIRFVQSLDHSYGSDEAGEYNRFLPNNIKILVEGDVVTLPKVIGAYYDSTTAQRELGDRLNSFNSHLIGGFNYFINTGFYLGLRYEYGLLDITNNAVDVSLVSLDENDDYIYRDDKDTDFTFSVSFGFRF
jgi:opacity protein-like surface antigen